METMGRGLKAKILIALVVGIILGLPIVALAVRQVSVNSSRTPITLLDDDRSSDDDSDAPEERDDNSGPGSGGDDNSGPGSGGDDNSGPGSG